MPKQDWTLESETAASRQSLFPEHPPFSMAMVIGGLLLALMAVLVTAAILVRVPETVRCRIVLVPEGGADPVRSTSTGYLQRVETDVRQNVRRGQVLFVIRAREMRGWMTERRAWATELRTAEQELAAFERRREARQRAHEAAADIQRARIRQLERDLAYQNKYVATYQEVLQRFEALGKERLLSHLDLLSHRLGAAKAERDAAMAQQSLESGHLELKQLQNSFEKQAAEEELDRQKIEVRIAGLQQQMAGNPADLVTVRAPYDGAIVSMERRAAGEAVSEGQELCRLARSDSPLVAELSPAEEAIPRLQPGQSVQLFYDAFPYQRYGTALATLRWLSPVVVHSPGGEQYVARASLQRQHMAVQGVETALKAGMQGESRIIVGRRSLIEYAFDPVRQLKENLAPPR